MNKHIHPFSPVHSVMLEIKRRHDDCPWRVSFQEFCARVQSGQEGSGLFDIDCSKLPTEPRNRMQYVTRHVSIREKLTAAVRCCLAAREPCAKPLLNLLDQAIEYCYAVDALRAQLARQALERHAARVKGGKERHERNRCAWVRAARLILVHAPEAGWKDEAQAARIIESRLAGFVTSRRLTLVCEGNFRRTIVRWIRTRPIVRAAFEQSRRPPAP